MSLMTYEEAVVRIRKMQKRYVRQVMEQQQSALTAVTAQIKCNECFKSMTAKFEDGEYVGHECLNGHVGWVSKRRRDPSAPRVEVERADPRGLPSQGNAPTPVSAAEVRDQMDRQRTLQKQLESAARQTTEAAVRAWER